MIDLLKKKHKIKGIEKIKEFAYDNLQSGIDGKIDKLKEGLEGKELNRVCKEALDYIRMLTILNIATGKFDCSVYEIANEYAETLFAGIGEGAKGSEVFNIPKEEYILVMKKLYRECIAYNYAHDPIGLEKGNRIYKYGELNIKELRKNCRYLPPR